MTINQIVWGHIPNNLIYTPLVVLCHPASQNVPIYRFEIVNPQQIQFLAVSYGSLGSRREQLLFFIFAERRLYPRAL